MPTTNNEATKIINISKEYLSLEKLRELFIKLDDEVGNSTENVSLKSSLQMMRLLVDPPKPPVPKWYWAAFYLLVSFHFAVIIGMALAFFILPFKVAWYVALPSMAFIFFLTTGRIICRLTELENWLRGRLGLPQIRGFIKHYFMNPVIKFFKR